MRISRLKMAYRIALGEFVVEVIETIGHTQCSVSYLINDEVMISSETYRSGRGF